RRPGHRPGRRPPLLRPLRVPGARRGQGDPGAVLPVGRTTPTGSIASFGPDRARSSWWEPTTTHSVALERTRERQDPAPSGANSHADLLYGSSTVLLVERLAARGRYSRSHCLPTLNPKV